jgi:putative membrane protein
MKSKSIRWPARAFCMAATVFSSLVLTPTVLAQYPQPAPGNPNNSRQPNTTQTNPSGAPDNTQVQDKMFLHNAAEGGMAEIQFGKLAAEKGGSDAVKQFGQKMVEDHTKLNDQMKPIAASMGVPEPKQLNKAGQAEYDKLNSLSGDAFDTEYITIMVKDHRKDLHEFRNEQSATTNPELKMAVAQAEPVISQHLSMIESIAQQKGMVVPGGHHGRPPTQ